MSRLIRNSGSPLPLAGATAATRYVGGTTTGIPTSGTFAVGDYVIGRTEGRVYVCTVAGTPGTWVDASQDQMQAGLGIKAWNQHPNLMQAAVAAATQSIYGLVIPTIAGMIYTGVGLMTNTAGTSTAPTGFFVGLATNAVLGSKGTMLAQSDDLHASAGLTTVGYQQYPFNAQYTETVTGLRQIIILMNGTFAGTNVAFARTNLSGNNFGAGSAQALANVSGTSQTALPSNTSLLPSSNATGGALCFFAALY